VQRIGLGGTPGMQFDRRDLRHGNQPIGIVDREKRLAIRLALANRDGNALRPCF
jgi:hypothetical protein